MGFWRIAWDRTASRPKEPGRIAVLLQEIGGIEIVGGDACGKGQHCGARESGAAAGNPTGSGLWLGTGVGAGRWRSRFDKWAALRHQCAARDLWVAICHRLILVKAAHLRNSGSFVKRRTDAGGFRRDNVKLYSANARQHSARDSSFRRALNH